MEWNYGLATFFVSLYPIHSLVVATRNKDGNNVSLTQCIHSLAAATRNKDGNNVSLTQCIHSLAAATRNKDRNNVSLTKYIHSLAAATRNKDGYNVSLTQYIHILAAATRNQDGNNVSLSQYIQHILSTMPSSSYCLYQVPTYFTHLSGLFYFHLIYHMIAHVPLKINLEKYEYKWHMSSWKLIVQLQ